MNPGNPDPGLLEVFHGAAEILLRQGGIPAPREAAGHAAQGAARAGAAELRRLRPDPGRLGGPARHSRLADPAEAEGRRHLPAAPRRAGDAPLAGALKVRFRAEVALGRFDDAIRTAKTMFAMSRHLGEHPTLIGNLVGIVVANAAIGPLEEMLEQPGCPNLYWALTNLPHPLVPLDKGMEGERVMSLSDGVPRPGRQRPDDRGPDQEIHRARGTTCSGMGRPSNRARAGAGVAGRADQGREQGRRRPPPSRRARPAPRSGCCGSRPTR